MNFQHTEDRRMLADTLNRFVAEQYGFETRDRIAGKAREAGDFAMGATGDLRGKVNDVTSQWQSSVSDLYERGRQVVERARSNIDAAVAEGQSTAQETLDELQRKAEG